jgi:hypothetical protein
MIHDENEYHSLRQQLLSEPTMNEHVRASRVASQIDFNTRNLPTDLLVQSKLIKRQQRASTLKPLIVHYTHEKQFAHYKSKIQQQWDNLFHGTSVSETRLIVGTRNNPNLIKELVRRSPHLPESG